MKDKILVTGATSGIGKEIAYTLKKAGYDVIIHGRRDEKIEEVLQKGRFSKRIKCDLSNLEEVQNVFSEFIRLEQPDILINNAGIGYPEDFLNGISVAKLQKIFNINTLSPILISNIFLKVCNHPRLILNISSTAGEVPKPFCPIYSSSKAAINQFTKSISQLYFKTNCRVNAISPGSINTEMTVRASMKYSQRKNISIQEAQHELYCNHVSEKHMGTVADIANVVEFICSDKANFVNGQIIQVNGGYQFEETH